ncbi:MAG: hypothetical protein HFI09_04220, partial [Bacilli bacterium]|nr:hypothetical protein [Bacilli bacterium]
MHKIRIKSEADLEKIKNLKGNDLIFLTIYNSFRPSIVSAIDLSNFGGKIVVIFVGKDYNSLIVFNPYNTPCKFLFANIGQAKVKMPYESPMSIVYHTIEHGVYVDSQQKFDNINTTFLHPKQITVHLNRDMVLDSFPSSFFSSYKGNVILTGDGNTLYIKDKKILKRLQEYCQFKYLNVELVDHIIPIYNAHDFNILRSIKKGKVVANICDDI